MSFAQSILEKYGWSEGQGLGKDSSGIVKPIKATFKFDNTGLGHDSANDFNNHWWERVYNSAASNLEVTKDSASNPTVKTINDSEDAVDISTSGVNYKKLKKKHGATVTVSGFGSFIKTSTLTNTGQENAITDRVNLDEFRHNTVKAMTDEELFKACGGRTAHKGARHGLKLSGKLARLAQQDEVLLSKYNKVEERSNKTANEETDGLHSILYQADYAKKLSRRKKKSKNRLETELSNSMDSFTLKSPTEEKSASLNDEKILSLNDEEARAIKKRKSKTKKLKSRVIHAISSVLKSQDSDSICNLTNIEDEDVKSKGKKKKRKAKKEAVDENSQTTQKTKKRKQVTIEIDTGYRSPADSETDITELDDTIDKELEKSAKCRRLEVMDPPEPSAATTKRIRNKKRKEEKRLAKSFNVSLNLAPETNSDSSE